MPRPTYFIPLVLGFMGLLCAPDVLAQAALSDVEQTAGSEDFGAHFQSTWAWQKKQGFAAAYSGPNSLIPQAEKSYSFTATAFLGWRLWQGGELYFNPEVAQGQPFSGLHGLGGYTDGEMQRGASSTPRFYRARLFLRQTWGTGGGQEDLEAGPNQLAGRVDKDRWTLTAGNLAATDLFDDNTYAHDPRTQFMNWALMDAGAYDYAADARGYTWGVALERKWGDWSVRAGRFIGPVVPNGQPLDLRILRHYGDQIEIERRHTLLGEDRPGVVRVLAFRNRAVMSRYQDALALAAATGQAPELDAVRSRAQVKHGFALNLEQVVSRDVGVFTRASWADGRTEIEAFTAIDRSLSLGALVQGRAWGRAQDTLGLALVQNGLSAPHRRYLAAGGMGPFLGDGALDYRPERIAELFYNAQLAKSLQLTLDWQHVSNPGYNRARGPVNVWSVRVHAAF